MTVSASFTKLMLERSMNTKPENGSGREIRRFYDTVKQHLRVLKAMKEDPTGSFITALLELKLDKSTMFEWQKACLTI